MSRWRLRMQTGFKRVSGLCAAALLGLTVLWWGCGGPPERTSPQTARVTRQNMYVSIVGQGKIESEFNRSVTPPRSWGLKIATLVPEGTKVKKDDVIITLDTSDLEKRLKDNGSDVTAGQARLENARENLKVVSERVQAKVDKARANYQIVKLEWEAVRAGSIQAAIEMARLLVNKATERAEYARQEMESWRGLAEGGVASQTDFEVRQLKYEESRIGLDKLRLELALLEAGATTADMRRAELNMHLAEIGLQAAKGEAEYNIARARESVTKAKAVLKLRQQNFDKTERLIKKCDIRAPVDGTVFHERIRTREGEEKVREGLEVRPWNNLVSLPDVSHLLIRIKIDEPRVAELKLGQPATIALESLRGETFTGTLKQIDPVARSKIEERDAQNEVKGEEAATKVFDVLVALDHPDVRIAPGLSGEAEIVTTSLTDVLVVPLQAVFQTNGQAVVYVVEEGKPRKVEVTLGASDRENVVITNGLSEGQEVYTRLPAGLRPEGTS